jgi:diguanylate cyclase (GGDEF)-like protein
LEALELSTQVNYSLLDLIEHPVVVVTPDTKVIYANAAARNILKNNISQYYLSQILHYYDGTYFKSSDLTLNHKHPIRCTVNKDHAKKHLDVYIKFSKQTSEHYFVVSFMDVTPYVQREQSLFKEATTDALTGICNRRHFYFQFDNELKRADREGSDIALIIFDIDHFKHVNDTYGHAVGDQVLQKITHVVSRELREIDIFGRIGGEEFGVVLPKANFSQIRQVACRLRCLVKNTRIPVGDKDISVTISIGISTKKENTFRETLVKQADNALYAAKHQGRDMIEYHKQSEIQTFNL